MDPTTEYKKKQMHLIIHQADDITTKKEKGDILSSFWT